MATRREWDAKDDEDDDDILGRKKMLASENVVYLRSPRTYLTTTCMVVAHKLAHLHKHTQRENKPARAKHFPLTLF